LPGESARPQLQILFRHLEDDVLGNSPHSKCHGLSSDRCDPSICCTKYGFTAMHHGVAGLKAALNQGAQLGIVESCVTRRALGG